MSSYPNGGPAASEALQSPRLAPAPHILVPYASHGWGGAEQHTLHLVEALAARGYEVTLLQLSAPVFTEREVAIPAGVRIVDAPQADIKRTPLAAWRRLFAAFEPDAIVFPKGAVTVGSFALDRAARTAASAFVTIEHGLPEPLPPAVRRGRWGTPVLELEWIRRRIRYAARGIYPQSIVCVSNGVRTRLATSYLFDKSRMTVVHNGTDTNRFCFSDAARQAARTEWGIPQHAIVIGYIGRLNVVKGVADLARMFASVADAHPDLDLRFVVVGEGPEHEAIAAAIRTAGIDYRTTLRGPTDTPWKVYPGFDVFALPSRTEGLPLAMLEAMATGVWPVCFDVGGIGEVLESERFGTLVPAGDLDAFSNALASAVSIDLAERRGTVRQRIVDSFEVSSTMAAIADVVDSSLGRQRVG